MTRFFLTSPQTPTDRYIEEARIIAEGAKFAPSKNREFRALLINRDIEKAYRKIQGNPEVVEQCLEETRSLRSI